MIKRAVIRVLAGLGYEARRRVDPFAGFDPDLRDWFRRLRPSTMLPPARLASLYRQALHCERAEIPGSFVECGVWKGGGVATMALANLRAGVLRRPLHLFDAFQEICEPDAAVDGARAMRETAAFRAGVAAGRLQPLTGIYDAIGGPGTLQENRDLLEGTLHYPAEFLNYHVGWFQDTLPTDAGQVGPIAILRIDSDWYASTKICLDHLFGQVVPGGFVIIDDYGTYDGCRQAVDEFVASRSRKSFLVPVDNDCHFWIKAEGS